MENDDDDTDEDAEVQEMGLQSLLPIELADIIMCLTEEDHPLNTLYLALTCKWEYQRYHRLGIFTRMRAVIRPLLVDRAYEEGTIAEFVDILPGEPGYAYWRAKHELDINIMWRNDIYTREQRRAKIIQKKKQTRRMKQAWKRGDYDSY